MRQRRDGKIVCQLEQLGAQNGRSGSGMCEHASVAERVKSHGDKIGNVLTHYGLGTIIKSLNFGL